jgi:ubiquinone/menaquinone biosynthesis C-methylase UbiE
LSGFEKWPRAYDAALACFEALGLARWRRWLAGGARGRTLDLGAGTGRNLPLLAGAAPSVAVDPHLPALLRAARRGRAAGVSLVVARAEALPFRDGAFDTVVCGLVLCSVDDPAAALAEVRRVLAPGGAVRALEHVRARSPLLARAQDLLQPAWTRVSGGCRPNRDTEAAFSAAGFALSERRAARALRRFVARPGTPRGGR